MLWMRASLHMLTRQFLCVCVCVCVQGMKDLLDCQFKVTEDLTAGVLSYKRNANIMVAQ